MGLATPSGWMNSLLFIDVLNHFIKFTNSSKENPTLIIMDNHESYFCQLYRLTKSNGITILTLPPHCSNKMLPLDVNIYGPFKSFYNNAVDSLLQNHPGKTLTIYDVSSCIGLAFEKSMSQKNIISGFKPTGNFSFDKAIFTDDDFLISDVTDRPNPTNLDNVIEDIEITQTPSNKNSVTAVTIYIRTEELRSYPIGEERKVQVNKWRKAKIIIITDIPEKNNIETRKNYTKRNQK